MFYCYYFPFAQISWVQPPLPNSPLPPYPVCPPNHHTVINPKCPIPGIWLQLLQSLSHVKITNENNKLWKGKKIYLLHLVMELSNSVYYMLLCRFDYHKYFNTDCTCTVFLNWCTLTVGRMQWLLSVSSCKHISWKTKDKYKKYAAISE